MKLFKAWAIAIAATVLCCAGARADLVMGPVFREIMATAASGGSPVVAGDSSMAPGLYSPAPISVFDSSPEAGTVHAHASQASSTPLVAGPSLGGIGAAGGDTTPGPGPAGVSLAGISIFNVFFTVSVDGDYLLDASVTWMGPIPPGGAFVTLEEDVPADPSLTGVTLASVSAGFPSPTATDSLTTILTLTAGTPYQLRAEAMVSGGGAPGTFAATATYAFTLTAVPEANAWLLTAPIALGLAIAAWRRRQRVVG